MADYLETVDQWEKTQLAKLAHMLAYWQKQPVQATKEIPENIGAAGRNIGAYTAGFVGDVASIVPGAQMAAGGQAPTSEDFLEDFGRAEHWSNIPSAFVAPGPGELVTGAKAALKAMLGLGKEMSGMVGLAQALFHGTPHKFSKFDVSKANPNDPDDVVNGIWFTSKEGAAADWARFPYGRPTTDGGHVMEAKIDLKKPASRKDVTSAAKKAQKRIEDGTHTGPNGTLQEETRLILQDEGFDGFVRSEVKVDRDKFFLQGEVALSDGRYLVAESDANDVMGVGLYDKDGGHITGYLDIDDAINQLEETAIVVFDESAITQVKRDGELVYKAGRAKKAEEFVQVYHGFPTDVLDDVKKHGIKASGDRARGATFATPKPDIAFAYIEKGGEKALKGVKRRPLVPDNERALAVIRIPKSWYKKHMVQERRSGLTPEVGFDTDIPPEFIEDIVIGDRKAVYDLPTTELPEKKSLDEIIDIVDKY